MKRAVLYARVSGDDRSNEGRNLNGQIDMCREHARDKGCQIVAELAEDDRGASGASFELPQLNKALEMAAASAFDVLVVREIDRLSRRLAKQLVVEEEFKRCGVQIEYVLGDYDDTPEGSLMKNVRAVIAEYERLKIIERMNRGRRLKVKSGSVLAYGRPPYGYRLVEDDDAYALKVIEAEAEVVRMIYEWYTGSSEAMAIAGITRKLTEMAIPTYFDKRPQKNWKKTGYGHWSHGSVHHILTNETYTGIWHYGKRGKSGMNPEEEWLSVSVPPIISQEIWQMAQDRLVENRRGLRRKTRYPYLLARRLHCGECGCKLVAQTTHSRGKHYLYYVCVGHRTTRKCTTRTFYPAAWLDTEVWKWVRGMLSDPAALKQGIEEYKLVKDREAEPIRKRLKIVDGLLDEYQEKLLLLLDLYLSGEFPAEVLTDRKHRLNTNISALEKERRELLTQLEAGEMSDEQLMGLQQFMEQIAVALDEAENDLEIRRGIVQRLQLEATLSTSDDGTKAAKVECLIGNKVLSLSSKTTAPPVGRNGRSSATTNAT